QQIRHAPRRRELLDLSAHGAPIDVRAGDHVVDQHVIAPQPGGGRILKTSASLLVIAVAMQALRSAIARATVSASMRPSSRRRGASGIEAMYFTNSSYLSSSACGSRSRSMGSKNAGLMITQSPLPTSSTLRSAYGVDSWSCGIEPRKPSSSAWN